MVAGAFSALNQRILNPGSFVLGYFLRIKSNRKNGVIDQNLIESDGDRVLLAKDGWKVPEENTGGNGTIVLDESSTVFDISQTSTDKVDSCTESPSSSDNSRCDP